MRKTLLLVPALVFGVTATARGGELAFLVGGMMAPERVNTSYSWQIDYRHGLGEHLAGSISYLNEGHVPVHHRDGTAAQLWARGLFPDRSTCISAGAGPYFFADTTDGPAGHSNRHGFGGIGSVSVSRHLDSGWLLEFRGNWVHPLDSPDSLSALVGVGYRIAPSPVPGPVADEPELAARKRSNEIGLFSGRTIVNSFSSDHATAFGIEYRRSLARYLDWTAGWLYEGDNRLLRRNGITTQFWLAGEFLEGRLHLGCGGGIYGALDHNSHTRDGEENSGPISGIVSLGGGWRLYGDWGALLRWNRIVTRYNRDSDVILAGVGYRF